MKIIPDKQIFFIRDGAKHVIPCIDPPDEKELENKERFKKMKAEMFNMNTPQERSEGQDN